MTSSVLKVTYVCAVVFWETVAREVHVCNAKASGGFGFLSRCMVITANNTFMKEQVKHRVT